jgi:CMP-N-acetylneuraminic acid synthetase
MMESMLGGSAYAVVPARGGSKGIPGKNLRTVDGVPLVVRAVTAARAAELVDRVIVSTDDDTIAALAGDAGAEVISRPSQLATDESASESVLVHALDALRERGADDPDVTVLVQCTSPFTEPSDIDGTIALLRERGADCAFTATRIHSFVWRDDPTGIVAVNHDAGVRLRRQDRPVEYAETGAVYAMRTDGLRRARHRFFGTLAVFEVPLERAIEIDDPGDLERAERLAMIGRAT